MTTAAMAIAYQDEAKIEEVAIHLFEQSCRAAAWNQIWGKLRRRNTSLLTLDDNSIHLQGAAEHFEQVELTAIVGDDGNGRSHDFDAQFRPLETHSRRRWISIAKAMLKGSSLPPVALIKNGQQYFVQDGHHRVSVAQALGKATIYAHVVVLDTE